MTRVIGSVTRAMLGLSRAMAVLGGMVLTALIVLVCLSVAGRGLATLAHGALGALLPGLSAVLLGLGVGPVTGDFELVEAGMAFTIFAFLPITQITEGHAVVDIFVSHMPARVRRALAALTELVFAAVLVLIAVQLGQGMASKMRAGTTTYLLQFPLWWAYAAALVPAWVAAAVGLWVAVLRWVELATGAALVPGRPAP